MPDAPLLTLAIASSALFDLGEGDALFRAQGPTAYRAWVRAHEDQPLPPGVAFPFVRRLLGLNRAMGSELVEVVLISRNDADTGVRVRNAIEHHRLPILRTAFTGGRDPWPYIAAFGACLFLSADPANVAAALAAGIPAGTVLPSAANDQGDDPELRLAFDFDGVLAGDASERTYREQGLEAYRAAERELAAEPLPQGPLQPLLGRLVALQEREAALRAADTGYRPVLRTAIVTARTAPADRRVTATLRAWGLRVDESFFVGDLPKDRILAVWRPHLFFDDKRANADLAAGAGPSVHVPFGILNRG